MGGKRGCLLDVWGEKRATEKGVGRHLGKLRKEEPCDPGSLSWAILSVQAVATLTN